MGFSPVIFYQKRPPAAPTQNLPTSDSRGFPQNAMVSTKIHRHEQAAKAFVTRETVWENIRRFGSPQHRQAVGWFSGCFFSETNQPTWFFRS